MTPFYADDWLTLYGGDCKDVLAGLPADSVDCVVTSPPYWGLRDYGTATWEGGDAECDHKGKPIPTAAGFNERYFGRPSSEGNKQDDMRREVFRDACGKCGATRVDSQLGLERTPEEYVANMVAVFREVRRVLKPSGTCWLNLGDSYNNRNMTRQSSHQGGLGFESADLSKSWSELKAEGRTRMSIENGDLKEKDLVGIPWMVAFALRADGWHLRSDIIWSKPNPMPESVTDRPTKAHEYLFLLTKSARYYFDADAVRETATWGEWNSSKSFSPNGQRAKMAVGTAGGEQWNGTGTHADENKSGRNIRSVWTIATRPYPGAHFAVFPPELPERCIKAGSSERGVCPECGAPWERQTVKTTTFEGGSGKAGRTAEDANANGKWAGKQYGENIKLGPVVSVETTGWRPSCRHETLKPAQSVVLDPFGGSGTVGMVANRLSRRAILVDLNPDYLKQQMKRNSQVPLGLAG